MVYRNYFFNIGLNIRLTIVGAAGIVLLTVVYFTDTSIDIVTGDSHTTKSGEYLTIVGWF